MSLSVKAFPVTSPKTNVLAAIQQLFKNGTVEFVRFEQPDTHGISRFKTVPARHFESFTQKGLNFPLPTLGLDVQGATAPNTGVLEEICFGDAYLLPDLETFQILPWADKTARVIGQPYYLDGTPVPTSSRQIVKALLAELEQLGYRLLTGFEYEFYLVDEVTRQASFPGIQLFGRLPRQDEGVIYEILRSLPAVGVDIITADLEYGPGQIEINFAPAWGLDSADQAFTFKNAVKEIAHRHGKIASFMTKPWIDQSASGCHFNQSLWQGKNSAFFDRDDPDGLSAVARHYLAGQLAHAPALTALIAPTINCWKRFQPNAFAPTNITWGIDNRTTAIRVKALKDERTHIENRLGTGSNNPYIVMAAMLAAGLDGIKRKLEPPAPIQIVADSLSEPPPLPTRLETALDALEQDVVIREALGEPFIHLFVGLKRFEIEKAKAAIANYDNPEFLNQVTDWERQEFFDVL
ncbi:glutamine synthetase family protein [Stenomitos frigidus]|uniref:glutamine synthetase n=1 Tax=Stenomitos frigidus ULC18 TaxID=2107698 RepID=A0A2T1E2R3_9CYAN|nr:glutamine synthetase family protein [Stenomitos frigidus]PSB27010.1 glutamine synthetase [Stenomitos frigidus ULC18]